MAMLYTNVHLADLYILSKQFPLDPNNAWSGFDTLPVYSTPELAAQACIDYMTSRPVIDFDDMAGNKQTDLHHIKNVGTYLGLPEAWIHVFAPSTPERPYRIVPGTASTPICTLSSGVDSPSLPSIPTDMYPMPSGYEIYHAIYTATFDISDSGVDDTIVTDGYFIITGLPDTTTPITLDTGTYPNSDCGYYINNSKGGCPAVAESEPGLLLYTTNEVNAKLDIGLTDPSGTAMYPPDWVDTYGFGNFVCPAVVMRGFILSEVPDEFQLAWNDDGRWYPNTSPTDLDTPLKYYPNVSVVNVDFADGARHAVIHPGKDGGFVIYETDSTYSIPFGLARVFRFDRTLSAVIPVDLLTNYLPRV